MLWDWDSWLSNIALRQILLENGTEKDKQEALKYEQGCILNSLHYGGMDGWIPIWIERNAPSREEMLKNTEPLEKQYAQTYIGTTCRLYCPQYERGCGVVAR